MNKVKEFFNKLIDKFRHNPLFEMVTSPDAEVTSSEEKDTVAQINSLAASSNISENEMWAIEKQFNEGESNLSKIEAEVSKIPAEPKESDNPFRVDESELNQDDFSDKDLQSVRQRSDGRERDD